ncbi:MAG: DNA repair protein RecN, partial [Chloroflexota bacterium]
LAIIDAVRIPFEPGLNAITGETGAGKSILIDALGAVLGGRVGAEVIRTGAPSARIEATFASTVLDALPALRTELMEIGVDPEDDVLILSREVTAAGRSSARINGRAVTVGVLNRIGSLLVDIHGQSDHLSLRRTAHHLDVLDRFGHTTDQRRAVAELVDEWQEITRQLRESETNARERAQRVDLLRFQLEEISAANLRSGEDDDLSRERSILANAERISSDISAAREALVGTERIGDAPGALDLTRTALRLLSDLIEMDPRLNEQRDRLGDAQALLEDVAAELRRHAEEVEFNPHRLQEVDDRLTEIRQLKRKYGTTTDEVIAFGAEVADALTRL